MSPCRRRSPGCTTKATQSRSRTGGGVPPKPARSSDVGVPARTAAQRSRGSPAGDRSLALDAGRPGRGRRADLVGAARPRRRPREPRCGHDRLHARGVPAGRGLWRPRNAGLRRPGSAPLRVRARHRDRPDGSRARRRLRPARRVGLRDPGPRRAVAGRIRSSSRGCLGSSSTITRPTARPARPTGSIPRPRRPAR